MYTVHYYGARPDTHDQRDYKKRYHQKDIPSKSFHPNIDLSKYVVEVYDQRDLGSCTANALCAAYGLDLKKQSETLKGGYTYFKPSRLFLYYNTRERIGQVDSDSGASIRDTVKALKCNGVCEESQWRYIYDFKKKPPQSCYTDAEGNNLCKYERLEQDIDQFRACLKDNCPFTFGFRVYSSFDKARNGVMPMPTSQEVINFGSPVGMHAVVAVGYDDSTEQIKVLNSWGSSWGHNGYFYMPYDFIKDGRFCFDFWKISFACQRGKPRPKDVDQYSSGYSVGGYGSYGGASGFSSHYWGRSE